MIINDVLRQLHATDEQIKITSLGQHLFQIGGRPRRVLLQTHLDWFLLSFRQRFRLLQFSDFQFLDNRHAIAQSFTQPLNRWIHAVFSGHILHDWLTENHTAHSRILIRQIAPQNARLNLLIAPFQMDGVETVTFKRPASQSVSPTLLRIFERVIRTMTPCHHDATDSDQQQNSTYRQPQWFETTKAIIRKQEDIHRHRHDSQNQEQNWNRIHRLPHHSPTPCKKMETPLNSTTPSD